MLVSRRERSTLRHCPAFILVAAARAVLTGFMGPPRRSELFPPWTTLFLATLPFQCWRMYKLAAGVKELSVPVPVPRRSAPTVVPHTEVKHEVLSPIPQVAHQLEA